MKSTLYNSIIHLVFASLIFAGCSETSTTQGRDSVTENDKTLAERAETSSGINYEYMRIGTRELPPDGGFWLINIAYFDHKGVKMFSSEDQGGAMPMPFSSTDLIKNAGIEECFSLIANGDSAIFYLSADSLFKNSYGRQVPQDMLCTKIELRVGVENVFSKAEFDEYNLTLNKERIAKEKQTIEDYIQKESIEAKITEEGLYYQIIKLGSGKTPLTGQKVRVNYTGKMLDGTVFDTSVEADAQKAGVYNPSRSYEPIEFPLGTGRVIKGWDIGIGLLPEGSKATFVIPSLLAYGKRATGSIEANSILVFNVELVEIVE